MDNENREESSYCASVMIELEPQEPSPGPIDDSVAANTENYQVLLGSHKPTTVGIEDMFLMASVPHHLILQERISVAHGVQFCTLTESFGDYVV